MGVQDGLRHSDRVQHMEYRYGGVRRFSDGSEQRRRHDRGQYGYRACHRGT